MTLAIREATKSDIPDIAKIHVAGWHGAYGGIVDPDYIESKTVENRIETWSDIFQKDESKILLAQIEGQSVGFLSYGALKTPPAGMSKIRPLYSSEIYALYLLPEFYRQGIGTALIKTSVESLKEQKHQSMCLWVLKDNKRGCSFYDSIKGQRVGKKILEMGRTNVKEVCYAWRDINDIL